MARLAAGRSPGQDEDPAAIADQVHLRLRDAILNATYRPNQRLVEEELAEKLQVSRTPVREALLRLRQEGLVTQRRGWTVRDHAPEEILQLIEARASIEASAAYLAAQRCTPSQLAHLDDLIERMEDPDQSRLKVNELNNEFHDAVTAAGGNPVLIEFSARTRINYWNFNQPVVFTPADDAAVNAQHRDLVDALRRGDAEAAQRIAREHVGVTAQILANALGLTHTGV